MQATIHGARIHYEREGSGLPVVFLHAGIADSRMWEPQVAAFAKHFDVVRPETRGFGQSDLPPQRWSPVADLLELMDQLQLKPAHLVGCSIGASTAIDFALEHSERISKLVLVGPGIGGANFGQKYPEVFANGLPLLQARAFATAQKPIAGSALGEPLTVAPAWKTVPSWYVVATQDRAINPELERFMAKRMNARVTELPAGHLVFISRAQDIARIIESASQ